jgi:RNA ligase (TIGR02306 family)
MDITRKLASVQKIVDIQPIVGADMIVRATVLAWHVVVKKNQFNVGDLCCYFEIDSLLPKQPWNEFLFKTTSDVYRLRTVKLRGQISQGLVVSLNDLPQIVDAKEGDDVTELLGITKWEPTIPAQLAGKVKGNFPSFLIKTDEQRIQGEPSLFEELKAAGKVYAAIKCDGSSMTCYNWENKVGVCSRNLDLLEDDNNSFWKIVNKYDLKNKLQDGYAIQAELVGPGIQDNRMGLKEIDCYVFNVYDIYNHKFLDYEEFKKFVVELGMKHVPVAYEGDLGSFPTINSMLDFASTMNYDNGLPAEGLVWRPVVEKHSEVLEGRLSLKTISNRFLLKYGE